MFANEFAAILLSASSNAANGQADNTMMYWMLALLVFFALYMWIISRRDKKQRAQEAEMKNSMNIGDDILTIGGVMGRVVSVKEDSFVLETGSDRTKIRFSKNAIATNLSANERANAAKEAAKAEKEAKKAKESKAKEPKAKDEKKAK